MTELYIMKMTDSKLYKRVQMLNSYILEYAGNYSYVNPLFQFTQILKMHGSTQCMHALNASC